MNKEIMKGLLVCIIVGILAKFTSQLIPFIGATSLAIIIGIVVGNTVAKDKEYLPGVKFSEKVLLPNAIMLLGVTLHLSALTKLGFKAVIFIVLEVSMVIFINLIIGKSLGFSRNFSLLMGSGNAVCGSSAIAATAPVLGAKEDEVGIPIAVINLIGTIFMFVLPFIAVKILKYSFLESSALIGAGLQSVGQVVAGGNFLGAEVGKFSILFKMIRISMLGGVVLVYSFINRENLNNTTSTSKKSKLPVPTFIIGFFVLSIMVSMGFINNQIQNTLSIISHTLLLVAMAGIGMRVKFKELLSEGPKALLFGFLAMLCQIILLVSLIKLIFIN